jgi:hypothetical protein
MTDIKDTRTLTLQCAFKVLNAAIAEATRCLVLFTVVSPNSLGFRCGVL